MINIAIDGPSGSGKSTLAKAIAANLGILYLDTGALYRAVALSVTERFGDSFSDEEAVSLLPSLHLDLRFDGGFPRVSVNGEDVTDRLRTQRVAMAASRVSALPRVREFLLSCQRSLAEKNDVVLDGRDVGTVILPNADVKIFLTASPEIRAGRRMNELRERGIEAEFDEILRQTILRDEQDTHRAVSPLRRADDAILLDNSELDMPATVDAAMAVIREKIR